MIEWKHRIKDSQGLHARPAAMLALAAGRFQSLITGECQGIQADFKDVIALLGLNAGMDCEIIIKIDGCDEEKAFHAVREVLKNL